MTTLDMLIVIIQNCVDQLPLSGVRVRSVDKGHGAALVMDLRMGILLLLLLQIVRGSGGTCKTIY